MIVYDQRCHIWKFWCIKTWIGDPHPASLNCRFIYSWIYFSTIFYFFLIAYKQIKIQFCNTPPPLLKIKEIKNPRPLTCFRKIYFVYIRIMNGHWPIFNSEMTFSGVIYTGSFSQKHNFLICTWTESFSVWWSRIRFCQIQKYSFLVSLSYISNVYYK